MATTTTTTTACARCGATTGLFIHDICGACPPGPQPGDVVRLDGHYDTLVDVGAHGVIDGTHFGIDFDDDRGPMVLVVFHASAFRGPTSKYAADQTAYVSCSGGPAPLVPIAELALVGTVEQRFWRWIDGPRAGGGEDYTLTVPLWAWAGRAR